MSRNGVYGSLVYPFSFLVNPYRLVVRSGRSVEGDRYTTIGAFSHAGRIVFVHVYAFIDRFIQFFYQILIGGTAWIHEKEEIVLGIARRDDMPFVTNGTYMTLEAFHNSGKERVELLL